MKFWYNTCFVDEVTEELKNKLPALAKAEGLDFLKHHNKVLSSVKESELDVWYDSPEGQLALVNLFNLIWAQMEAVSEWAMPAHDARHAIYKVPATALEYIKGENVKGYKRIGIFGALLHDHGRWAEERIFGGPGGGMLHARLGFLLARELISQIDIPEDIASQILHCVIQHTSGAKEDDIMPVKITVSSDRDQLYGPEMVLRLTHHPVQEGSLSSMYGEKGGGAVLERLAHFLRNRLPGPLYSRIAHVEELKSLLRTFILMAEPLEDSAKRFGFGDTAPKRRGETDFEQWEADWYAANKLWMRGLDMHEELLNMLKAPNIAPGFEFEKAAVEKLSNVPETHAERLAGAFRWVTEARIAQDMRQEAALREIATEYRADLVISTIAEKLLSGWR